jgi:hypothetical protein
MQGSGYTEQ